MEYLFLLQSGWDWILGYNHYLGECSVFKVLFWGILIIGNEQGYERMLIRMDSMEVVKTIEDIKGYEFNLG